MQQQYFTEQAVNYEEAYKKVREKYGDNATILIRKSVMIRGGFLGLFLKEGVEVSGPIPQIRTANVNSYQVVGSTYQVPGNYRPQPPKENDGRNVVDFEKEKLKVLAAAGKNDPTLQMVLSEVRTIKEKLDSASFDNRPEHETHPSLARLDDILSGNDFPSSFRAGIINRIKKEFPLDGLDNFDAVQQRALEWIGESISIYNDEKFHRRPRIMILVGPTGVGKTTTIAKLATNFGIDQNGQKIREIILITIDTFRIGARQQLEAYGKILQTRCFAADEFSDLKKIIALHSDDADVILIDTVGKSPRDYEKLGQMKKLLEASGQAEVHLAVSAATKSSDLEEILQQFEPFNYKSVIITKMDETTRVGNILGVLADKRKSVSYITNGQKVPADIKKASVMDFLINLDGFHANRTKLDALFPDNENEQFRKWS